VGGDRLAGSAYIASRNAFLTGYSKTKRPHFYISGIISMEKHVMAGLRFHLQHRPVKVFATRKAQFMSLWFVIATILDFYERLHLGCDKSIRIMNAVGICD
jgi:hypothetical protein